MDFEAKWREIQNLFSQGGEVPNWTAKKGYLGDKFQVLRVRENVVQIESPGAICLQTVPKKYFAYVYGIWSDYLSGEVQRQKIIQHTRFSKYVISILKLLDSGK